MERYHDEEWGDPVLDERGLFERMSLEAFQSGLSWRTILKKRDAFRTAFAGFEPDAVARFEDSDVARLLADAEIVRNRASPASAPSTTTATTRRSSSILMATTSSSSTTTCLERRRSKQFGRFSGHAQRPALGEFKERPHAPPRVAAAVVGGSFTRPMKKSSIWCTMRVNWSKSTGLVM
jgi:hypothetical protein